MIFAPFCSSVHWTACKSNSCHLRRLAGNAGDRRPTSAESDSRALLAHARGRTLSLLAPARARAVRSTGKQRWVSRLRNVEESARSLIIRYAGRNCVEDALGISVNFFHLDCLASEVRLNVDLDTTLTVLANGCYRWLAKQLRGFEAAAPKQLFRKFVETSGTIEIEKDRIIVRFDKRCHNPILREAALDQPGQKIPWLQNLSVVFQYP
jgi:hypothetical protein